MNKHKFYVTTFCNFAHRLSDGKPVEHECYILDPEALQAEARGDFGLGGAESIVKEPRRMMRRGVRAALLCPKCEGDDVDPRSYGGMCRCNACGMTWRDSSGRGYAHRKTRR